MSKLDEATENPNDKMPAGKPLNKNTVVQEEFEDEQTTPGGENNGSRAGGDKVQRPDPQGT